MKKIIIHFALLILFISCKNEKIATSYGEMTVKIDNIEWSGQIVTRNGIRIYIIANKNKTIDGYIIPWEILELGLVPKNEKISTLYKRDSMVNYYPDLAKTYAGFSTTQDDGDVSCDLYEVIESDSINNWVHITKQVNNFSEVWGEFSVTFHRIWHCPLSNYADTLHLRDGKFHIFLN